MHEVFKIIYLEDFQLILHSRDRRASSIYLGFSHRSHCYSWDCSSCLCPDFTGSTDRYLDPGKVN